MPSIDRFKERYRKGETPWDLGRPDFNMVEIVTRRPIAQCKTLEIGCGSGNDAIFLAQHGFTLTGIDVSRIALDKAEDKAAEAGVKPEFMQLDFLSRDVPGGPFKFIYDRGCFHHAEDAKARETFAQRVAAHVEEGGLWLSLIGSTDGPDREGGPPRRSLTQVVLAVEPYFEILSARAGYFDSGRETSPGNWVCLMKRR